MRSIAAPRSGRRAARVIATPGALAARRRTRRPGVALVMTSPRSTPRCTIVCAICGRMPLMMQSAPISRAAATVFSRCCATSVSTVGTPVMSMIAIAEPVSTIRCEQALHHDLGARAVERADQRQRQDAVPQLDHRRRELEQLLLLAADHLLARSSGRPRSCRGRAGRAARSSSTVASAERLRRRSPSSLRSAVEQRLLEREDERRGLGRREALASRASGTARRAARGRPPTPGR